MLLAVFGLGLNVQTSPSEACPWAVKRHVHYVPSLSASKPDKEERRQRASPFELMGSLKTSPAQPRRPNRFQMKSWRRRGVSGRQGAACARLFVLCVAIKNNWQAGFSLRIFQECQWWSNDASLGMLKASSARWHTQLAAITGIRKEKKIIKKKKNPGQDELFT